MKKYKIVTERLSRGKIYYVVYVREGLFSMFWGLWDYVDMAGTKEAAEEVINRRKQADLDEKNFKQEVWYY